MTKMKGLIRWGLIFSLAGCGLVAPIVGPQVSAIALTEAEAVKRLERVPVFAVTNPEGSPILAAVPNPKDKTKQVQVATFFMGQKDAQTFVDTLKAKKPDIGKIAKVVPISLKQAYEITQKNKDKQDSLVFQFVPTQEQIKLALDIVNKDKKQEDQVKVFNGVPLFYAVGGEEKGLLTISDQTGKNKIIPFYFRKQDLDTTLKQLQKQDTKLSSSTVVEVTSLDRVLNSLLKETGPAAEQITLVPSADSIQFAMEQQKGASQPQGAPKAAPSDASKDAPQAAPTAAPSETSKEKEK